MSRQRETGVHEVRKTYFEMAALLAENGVCRVLISVDMPANRFCLDAAFDNFRVDLRVAKSKSDCKNGGRSFVLRADSVRSGSVRLHGVRDHGEVVTQPYGILVPSLCSRNTELAPAFM